MYFLAFAVDYDGTIARDGDVSAETVEALHLLKQSGRRLVLVTGRQLDELKTIFPAVDLFDRVVVENGAAVYNPQDGDMHILAQAPPASFAERLRERGVGPVATGHVIVATWHPHERAVLGLIAEMGLELQIIFNKGAIMVLPSNVNKASGLLAALDELNISPLNVVGAGDAENDHSFLSLCGCSAAVANALPVLKQEVDIVLSGDHGIGIVELVRRILDEDAGLLARTQRGISAGTDVGGDRHYLLPEDLVLIVGNSGCGKSSYATLLTEEMAGRHHEFCVIDPEGDYIDLDDAETIGGLTEPPTTQEALRLLLKARVNVVINAQALGLNDRQRLFNALMESIRDLRKATGRPQWLVIDESHHMMPSSDSNDRSFPSLKTGAILLTLTPRALPRPILKEVTMIIAMGSTAYLLLGEFAHLLHQPPPVAGQQPGPDEKLLWRPKSQRDPVRLRAETPRQIHNRHAGKYATGDIGEWHSFYFRGPGDIVNIRARNLSEFVRVSRTLNEGIWDYHLQRDDYAEWFQQVIKDDFLAQEAQAAKANATLGIDKARDRLIDAISCRYKI